MNGSHIVNGILVSKWMLMGTRTDTDVDTASNVTLPPV